uniref:Ig-like domain-containing protein n=1 Tax=Gasterosteus aculeatus aculeatus TaxID=481459 RepID=A0AAQ4RB08_GASAC
MKHWMGNMLILTLWLECSGEDTVTQSTGEVIATEGHTVTLDCTFEISSSINAYLFWYKQEVNNQLMYILRLSDDKTRMDLKISSATVSDSAVYYCAVKPTVTGNTKTLYKNLWSKDNSVHHPPEGVSI